MDAISRIIKFDAFYASRALSVKFDNHRVFDTPDLLHSRNLICNTIQLW